MFENAINFSNIFTLQNLIIYLIVINILAFLSMWLDKKKAQKGKWRISEGSLFILAILGGSIGSIVGMYTFRHKTKKTRFTVGLPVILITEILIILFYVLF